MTNVNMWIEKYPQNNKCHFVEIKELLITKYEEFNKIQKIESDFDLFMKKSLQKEEVE